MAEYWNDMYGFSDDDDRSSSDDTTDGDNCAGRIVLGLAIGVLTGGLFG